MNLINSWLQTKCFPVVTKGSQLRFRQSIHSYRCFFAVSNNSAGSGEFIRHVSPFVYTKFLEPKIIDSVICQIPASGSSSPLLDCYLYFGAFHVLDLRYRKAWVPTPVEECKLTSFFPDIAMSPIPIPGVLRV